MVAAVPRAEGALMAECDNRCFACNRPIRNRKEQFVMVKGESTTVPVGSDCYAKVRACDADGGYQPPLGGPRLVLIGSRG